MMKARKMRNKKRNNSCACCNTVIKAILTNCFKVNVIGKFIKLFIKESHPKFNADCNNKNDNRNNTEINLFRLNNFFY